MPLGGKKYRDGYERTFGNKAAQKSDAEEVTKDEPADEKQPQASPKRNS